MSKYTGLAYPAWAEAPLGHMVSLAGCPRNMKHEKHFTLEKCIHWWLKREEVTFYGKIKMSIYLANIYTHLEPVN